MSVYGFIYDRIICDVRHVLRFRTGPDAVDFVLNSTSDIIPNTAHTVQHDTSFAARLADHFPPGALDAVREVLSRS